ncbi:MAG: hypothetical protein Q7S06_02895 [Nanoarchaeota archaeon]|nr:hypothetical protein [Nanoarchaeota archaeon]
MINRENVPDGLELEIDKSLRVKIGYRTAVKFDDILPGDLLMYRGKDIGFCLVHSRSRNHLSGNHFGDVGGPGGWGQDFNSDVQIDRIAPCLLKSILNHYSMDYLLDDLSSGKPKIR